VRGEAALGKGMGFKSDTTQLLGNRAIGWPAVSEMARGLVDGDRGSQVRRG